MYNSVNMQDCFSGVILSDVLPAKTLTHTQHSQSPHIICYIHRLMECVYLLMSSLLLGKNDFLQRCAHRYRLLALG